MKQISALTLFLLASVSAETEQLESEHKHHHKKVLRKQSHSKKQPQQWHHIVDGELNDKFEFPRAQQALSQANNKLNQKNNLKHSIVQNEANNHQFSIALNQKNEQAFAQQEEAEKNQKKARIHAQFEDLKNQLHQKHRVNDVQYDLEEQLHKKHLDNLKKDITDLKQKVITSKVRREMQQETEKEMQQDIDSQQAQAQKGLNMDVEELEKSKENSKRVEGALQVMKKRTEKVNRIDKAVNQMKKNSESKQDEVKSTAHQQIKKVDTDSKHKNDGDLTDPNDHIPEQPAPVVAKKKSNGKKNVPKSSNQHFYDPNDHVPEGAKKVPLVMPGQNIDMIVAGPVDSLPQVVSTNPLVISLPASRDQEGKYKSMLQGTIEQQQKNQKHQSIHQSQDNLGKVAEFANKSETILQNGEPEKGLMTQNQLEGLISAQKSATPVVKKEHPLIPSKLETTLQNESKGIKEAPLHASKLERSLKNMEGIAKITGNKNGLMTKVVEKQEKLQDDFLADPKLSNLKEANSVNVKIEKKAVKSDKASQNVKVNATATPKAVVASVVPTASTEQFEESVSNHLHVPKKSEAQKAIDKVADDAAAAKKKANHKENKARHDYLGSDHLPQVFVNRNESPVEPHSQKVDESQTHSQKPEGSKSQDVDLYVAAQKDQASKLVHPKQATIAAIQINSDNQNQAYEYADEQEREQGQQKVVVKMQIQSQAELEAFEQQEETDQLEQEETHFQNEVFEQNQKANQDLRLLAQMTI